MNGLLTHMLSEIGFKVTRVGAGIGMLTRGERVYGNHLVGLIDLGLDAPYVVDVGLRVMVQSTPFLSRRAAWTEDGFEFRLERLDDKWWRFHNHQHSLSTNFDFTQEPRDLSWYREPAARLESHESSPFAKHLVTIRRKGNVIRALVDLTYSEISADWHRRNAQSLTRMNSGACSPTYSGWISTTELDAIWELCHASWRDLIPRTGRG